MPRALPRCSTEAIISSTECGSVTIHRQADAIQRVHRFAPVDRFRRQHQIRLERHDLFQIRIHGPAHVRFLHGLRRIIAKIGVARQMISVAQRKNNFRKIRRKRNDAIHFLRNSDSPAVSSVISRPGKGAVCAAPVCPAMAASHRTRNSIATVIKTRRTGVPCSF